MAVVDSCCWQHPVTSAERREAVRLYNSRCSSCHHLYDPADYSDEEWKLWMQKMEHKSRLNPREARLLDDYLNEYRATAGNAP